jgi:biotin carboxylase
MKKILLLGAMQMHIPLIKRAKQRGIYVITCDYIPENEGHKYADEAYYESTTDNDAVKRLAISLNVDAILTFNSDPAALTAASVAAKLGLPNSNVDAVRIMSEKDLFRTYLYKNGFNTPNFGSYENFSDLQQNIDAFTFPVILKPVDSSGSKGVTIVQSKKTLDTDFAIALTYSRCKRIIVEEFIQTKGPQIHGDAFIRDGMIDFIYLGDHHFDREINNLVPYSTTFPSQHMPTDIQLVEREVQRFITEVGFKQGGINIEARISLDDGKVYLIEIGPRNGGNFTPIIIEYATGYNFIDAALNAALGMNNTVQDVNKKGYFAYLVLHSDREGILKSINISKELEAYVLEKHIYLHVGDIVKSFRGANAAIGVLLVQFPSLSEMNRVVDDFTSFYSICLLDE